VSRLTIRLLSLAAASTLGVCAASARPLPAQTPPSADVPAATPAPAATPKSVPSPAPTPPYVQRGDAVEAHYKTYKDRLAQYYDTLCARVKADACPASTTLAG